MEMDMSITNGIINPNGLETVEWDWDEFIEI
jgi:hypothetical protein